MTYPLTIAIGKMSAPKASPKPIPLDFVVTKASKIVSASCGLTTGPVSSTARHVANYNSTSGWQYVAQL